MLSLCPTPPNMLQDGSSQLRRRQALCNMNTSTVHVPYFIAEIMRY